MLSYHNKDIGHSSSVFCWRVLQKRRRRREQDSGHHSTIKSYLDTAEEHFKFISADDNLCSPST